MTTQQGLRLLIEHQAAILADCRTLLAGTEEQSFLVTQLGRTIDACVAGFHESAQAHRRLIIDTALRIVRTVGEEQLELQADGEATPAHG